LYCNEKSENYQHAIEISTCIKWSSMNL
jgi:hypothetical protein